MDGYLMSLEEFRYQTLVNNVFFPTLNTPYDRIKVCSPTNKNIQRMREKFKACSPTINTLYEISKIYCSILIILNGRCKRQHIVLPFSKILPSPEIWI